MRKLLKFLLVMSIILLSLIGGGWVALKHYVSPQKIQNWVAQYAKENWNREVSFHSVSFNWIGLTLRDFSLSEEISFANGTFIQARTLVAKVAVKPLLKKRIEINTLQLDGLELNLVQQKDGNFNFASFATKKAKTFPQQPQNTSEGHNSFSLSADEISVSDCKISYKNETQGTQSALDHLNLEIHRFNLTTPFRIKIDSTIQLNQKSLQELRIPIQTEGVITLSDLNWKDATAKIDSFTAHYQDADLVLSGNVNNFTAPQIDLEGKLQGLSAQTLKQLWPESPEFSVPTLAMKILAQINLEKSLATVSEATLSAQDNRLVTNGHISWEENNNNPYSFSGTLQADLTQLMKMKGGSSLQPTGKIDGSFKATSKKGQNDFSGLFSLQNVSLLYSPFTFEQVSGSFSLFSLQHFSAALTGLLNQSNFVGNFSYQSTPSVNNLTLNLDLDKLVLTEFPSSNKETASPSSEKKVNNSPLLNLNGQIKIGEVTVPHFHNTGLTLQANLTQLSDSMKQANGTLSFSLQPGSITDLEVFVKENKFVKILFLPLNVIRKVSQALKLNIFPSEEKDKSIPFTMGEGSYTFTNGVMNIDNTVFKSSLVDIQATGTINFPEDTLRMLAHASLLTDTVPMVIKITGTPQNPKGKLDITRTVGSVLENMLNGKTEKATDTDVVDTTEETVQAADTLVKDAVTDAATTLKDIGKFFKKKTNQ